jgi:hypothetical protein
VASGGVANFTRCEKKNGETGERRSGYYYTERIEKEIAEIGAGEYLPRNEDSREDEDVVI